MTKNEFDNLCSIIGTEYVYDNIIKPELNVDDEYSKKNSWDTYFKQSNIDPNFINPCAEKYYIFSVIYECTNITFL